MGPITRAYFDRQADAVRLELTRADNKVNSLLAFTGTAFSVLSALAVLAAGKLPALGIAGIGIAVAGLGVATVVLLFTILPNLPPRGQGVGFTLLAGYQPSEIDKLRAVLDQAGPGDGTEALHLADIAYSKFIRIRVATRIMIAALIVLGVTATALIVLS